MRDGRAMVLRASIQGVTVHECILVHVGASHVRVEAILKGSDRVPLSAGKYGRVYGRGGARYRVVTSGEVYAVLWLMELLAWLRRMS